MKMKHAALFNGIGGFQLAAEWVGWENVMSCEIDNFCNKVTKYHYPNCIQHEDIRTTDFSIYRGCIDILTGGFPCQPYSQAGKRKGKEDDRHLWPEMLRAIREIQPGWVVGENVLGLVNWSGGLVFHEVQTDLEAEGYEVFPYVLPACAVNAPHRRDRVWFVAYRNVHGQHRSNGEYEKLSSEVGQYAQRDIEPGSCNGANTDTNCEPVGKEIERRNEIGSGERETLWNTNIPMGETDCPGTTTNTDGQRLQQQPGNPFAIEPGQLSRLLSQECDWSNFPTQSPLCNGNDGLSEYLDITSISFPKWRNESIKAGGNAIVPEVAHQIFKAIQQYEQTTPLY